MIRLGLLALGVVLLGGSGATASAAQISRGTYAGSSTVATADAVEKNPLTVTISSGSRPRATVIFNEAYRCGPDLTGRRGFPGNLSASLRAGGRVKRAASFTRTFFAGAGTGMVTYLLEGRFADGRFRGTLRMHLVVRNTAGVVEDECDSGVVKLAATRDRRLYAGKTAQNRPLTLRASKADRVLRFYVNSVTERCEQQQLPLIGSVTLQLADRFDAINETGTFGVDVGDGGGLTATGTITVSGRRKGRTLRGFFEVRYDRAGAPQAPAVSCTTGKVSWSAHVAA